MRPRDPSNRAAPAGRADPSGRASQAQAHNAGFLRFLRKGTLTKRGETSGAGGSYLLLTFLVPYLIPPNKAISNIFIKQSTSLKPISRNQIHCCSTKAKILAFLSWRL